MRPDRRIFLKSGGLAMISLGLDPLIMRRAAGALSGTSTARKTLICVFQRGAVDGLSMIVPHGEQQYYRHRARVAIPRPRNEAGTLDLDGHFGLHPALDPLVPLYRDGMLAPIHAVGSPDSTRSHFDAQDYMETGTPGVKSTRDGWLNRHLAHAREHEDTPFRGVSIGNRLPRALRGTAPALAIPDIERFGIGRRGRTPQGIGDSFEQLYGAEVGTMQASAAEAFEAIRILRESEMPESRDNLYPRSGFARSMRQLARLIKMEVGLEIGFASVGGWDTHANQGASQGQLANNLRQFGATLKAFADDLGPRMADVVVLTMSEFGRTVAENGNGGTDHGHATAMMVMGGDTAGGRVHGNWPGLETDQLYEGRDLAVTTDFRDLFSEVLVKHLGATDLATVFPGYQADVNRWPGVIQ